MARYGGKALTTIPLADGTSYYCPYFCAEVGLDADELWSKLGRGDVSAGGDLWLDPALPCMGYRGNQLKRVKFFVNLHPELTAKYSYSGYQHEALEHYHERDSLTSRFVADTSDHLVNGLSIDCKPVSFSQAIGTLYRDPNHNIGGHSDRPADIAPASYIVDLSFGAERVFVMRERTAEEQAAWLAKPPNKKAATENYINLTGRTEDVVTMQHGSCIILSTSTNSRWTHEVPPPVGYGPVAPRASLIFRNIATLLTTEKVAKLVAGSKRAKARAAAKKAAKRAKA